MTENSSILLREHAIQLIRKDGIFPTGMRNEFGKRAAGWHEIAGRGEKGSLSLRGYSYELYPLGVDQFPADWVAGTKIYIATRKGMVTRYIPAEPMTFDTVEVDPVVEQDVMEPDPTPLTFKRFPLHLKNNFRSIVQLKVALFCDGLVGISRNKSGVCYIPGLAGEPIFSNDIMTALNALPPVLGSVPRPVRTTYTILPSGVYVIEHLLLVELDHQEQRSAFKLGNEPVWLDKQELMEAIDNVEHDFDGERARLVAIYESLL